jgi:hypothetical protein
MGEENIKNWLFIFIFEKINIETTFEYFFPHLLCAHRHDFYPY